MTALTSESESASATDDQKSAAISSVSTKKTASKKKPTKKLFWNKLKKANGLVRKTKKHPAFNRKTGESKDDKDSLVENFSSMTLEDTVPVSKFQEMGLKPDLLKGILALGLKEPAYCQQRVIMPIIQGRDVLCQAQSGMGKTAAFCIGLLQRIDPKISECQVLVLAPTRELATQIADVFRTLSKFMRIKCVRCVGGTKTTENIEQLEHAHIAVGTLGRVCNLLVKKVIDADSLHTLVIDEADKMVCDYSFRKDMSYIIGELSATAQTIVMSATMSSYAIDLMLSFMRNPCRLLVKNDQLTLDGIQQFYVNVETEDHKIEALSEIYPFVNKASGIVFCNTRNKAKSVSTRMQTIGHEISEMIGTLTQQTRANTLHNFRAGKIPVLVASDLLGRGIDVDHVKLVINYELPEQDDVREYIHRVGRAGRYGKKGIAITFVTDKQMEMLENIQTFYSTTITAMPKNINELVLNA